MDFKWLNEGQMKEENNKIEMIAPAQSDFFFNNGAIGDEGITPESLCNAPFYYTEIAGDFVMRVKVAHDFKDTYDSASIMVMQDMRNWAKRLLILAMIAVTAFALGRLAVRGALNLLVGGTLFGGNFL